MSAPGRLETYAETLLGHLQTVLDPDAPLYVIDGIRNAYPLANDEPDSPFTVEGSAVAAENEDGSIAIIATTTHTDPTQEA